MLLVLNTPTSTRSYINTTSFSWANKLGSQPLLLIALQIQQILFLNTSLQPMMTFMVQLRNIWCFALRDRIRDGVIIEVLPNTVAEETLIKNWLYTP